MIPLSKLSKSWITFCVSVGSIYVCFPLQYCYVFEINNKNNLICQWLESDKSVYKYCDSI